MPQSSFHEKLSQTDDVKIGRDQTFGFVFAFVFVVIGLFPLWGGEAPRIWSLVVAGFFLALAFIAPKRLAPLNFVWFKFGLLLHKIVSPLVMGLIFFGTVLPIGLLMRLFGKRPLDTDFDSAVRSYWIHRKPPAPEPDSMTRQF